MTEKQFTRAEINKLLHDISTHYYRMFGDDMTLSEKLFFRDVHETLENQLDYKMELLEKGD